MMYHYVYQLPISTEVLRDIYGSRFEISGCYYYVVYACVALIFANIKLRMNIFPRLRQSRYIFLCYAGMELAELAIDSSIRLIFKGWRVFLG